MKMIDAKEFERNFQHILEELAETGGSVTVTSAGRPVAAIGFGTAIAAGRYGQSVIPV